MVHLRSVRRPYGSFTARWKAVRLTLRTVNRTHGQLKALFRRQHGKYLRRDFLYIFMFYSFISYVFLLYFSVLLKQLQRLYIGSFIFQVPPVYNYSTCCTNCIFIYLVYQPLTYTSGVLIKY